MHALHGINGRINLRDEIPAQIPGPNSNNQATKKKMMYMLPSPDQICMHWVRSSRKTDFFFFFLQNAWESWSSFPITSFKSF